LGLRLPVGQYVPGDSPVHRLDARTKILATAVYTAALLAGRGPWALAACAAFTALGLALARPPLAALWRGNRALVGLVLITAVIDVLAYPGGTVLWRLGPLAVGREGLQAGLGTGARLGLLVLQAALLTLTTAPLELCAGAERCLLPLRRLGVPAHELGLMAGLALRFLPLLAEEAERIAMAQAARGADLQGRGRSRARALVALLVPLLLGVFRRAEQLALAMEARGYRGAEGRTRWRQSRLGPADGVAAGLLAALVAVVAWSALRHL
jgi:energy-coupling factor transport system permease protein